MLVLDMLNFLLRVDLDQLVEQPETRVFHIPPLDNLRCGARLRGSKTRKK